MPSRKKSEGQWPADQVERRKVADLKPYAKNSRTHSDKQIEQLVASINEWGFTVPILVDEKGEIIAGHGRVLAAGKAGIEEVPAMVAAGWTEKQKRAYVIADNKLAENANWDQALLTSELKDLSTLGFSLEKVGFESTELVTFLAQPSDFSPEDDASGQKSLTDYGAEATCPECGHKFDPLAHG